MIMDLDYLAIGCLRLVPSLLRGASVADLHIQ